MSRKNTKSGKVSNIYPLADRTVSYSHKKYLKPVPVTGKKYHCFDDGKITFSRHYIVEVVDVLGQMQFKKKYHELFEKYLRVSKSHYWLFSRSTDVFVVSKSENGIEIFVRTKQGGWFSFGKSTLVGGRLDVTGNIWVNLVENIDMFDYTDEEKKKLIEEGTI